MPTYVQDKATGKFVLKGTESQVSNGPMIMGDIEPFISPITKKPITSRSQLRRHNKIHGVTDSRDYSPATLLKNSQARVNRMMGNTPEAKAERRELINQELRRRGI